MDRGAWRTAFHGVPKSQTRLKQLSMYAYMWLPVGFNQFSPHSSVWGPRSVEWRIACMGSSCPCLARILWALEFASICGPQGLTYSITRWSTYAGVSVYTHGPVTVFVTGGVMFCCRAISCHIGFCALTRAQEQCWISGTPVAARRCLVQRCLGGPLTTLYGVQDGEGTRQTTGAEGRTFQTPQCPRAILAMAHHCWAHWGHGRLVACLHWRRMRAPVFHFQRTGHKSLFSRKCICLAVYHLPESESPLDKRNTVLPFLCFPDRITEMVFYSRLIPQTFTNAAGSLNGWQPSTFLVLSGICIFTSFFSCFSF